MGRALFITLAHCDQSYTYTNTANQNLCMSTIWFAYCFATAFQDKDIQGWVNLIMHYVDHVSGLRTGQAKI